MDLANFKGVIIRKGDFTDKKMVTECLANYTKFSLDENSIVLDLGTYIGGFAVMALKYPIKKYIGVEADAENYGLLQRNVVATCKNDICTLLHGAASASSEETLTFSQTESKQHKCSGTVSPNPRSVSRRTRVTKVKNYNIDALIEEYQPTHVKVDIEGAEYDWFKQNLGKFHPCIKEISFELHTEPGTRIFENLYLDNVLQDFDVVKVTPNSGFATVHGGKPTSTWKLDKFGIEGAGVIFGVDCFFRRK